MGSSSCDRRSSKNPRRVGHSTPSTLFTRAYVSYSDFPWSRRILPTSWRSRCPCCRPPASPSDSAAPVGSSSSLELKSRSTSCRSHKSGSLPTTPFLCSWLSSSIMLRTERMAQATSLSRCRPSSSCAASTPARTRLCPVSPLRIAALSHSSGVRRITPSPSPSGINISKEYTAFEAMERKTLAPSPSRRLPSAEWSSLGVN
mmetsp:Transcript_19495/g.54806  ORF Transcript_19495/g.54806 Transcript_19495/m.54806 type:complete len:202 (+) Transcript_19495:958-1563(+)